MAANFTDEFETKERELIVLTKGTFAASGKNVWSAYTSLLAFYDVENDIFINEKGALTWPLTENEYNSPAYRLRFQDETIYRVSVRFLKDRTVPEGRTPSYINTFHILRVLEENVRCFPLEQALIQYKTPVFIDSDILGKLKLNKSISTFSGSARWKNEEIEINFSVDQKDKNTWVTPQKVLIQLLQDAEQWDQKMRMFAASELTVLANAWREEEEEEEEITIPVITEKAFAERLNISSIYVSEDSSFVVYFGDDYMFLGHCVAVYGSIDNGITSATMEG